MLRTWRTAQKRRPQVHPRGEVDLTVGEEALRFTIPGNCKTIGRGDHGRIEDAGSRWKGC
eukprot:6742498-Prorocentrum_lima.AAC.1